MDFLIQRFWIFTWKTYEATAKNWHFLLLPRRLVLSYSLYFPYDRLFLAIKFAVPPHIGHMCSLSHTIIWTQKGSKAKNFVQVGLSLYKDSVQEISSNLTHFLGFCGKFSMSTKLGQGSQTHTYPLKISLAWWRNGSCVEKRKSEKFWGKAEKKNKKVISRESSTPENGRYLDQ